MMLLSRDGDNREEGEDNNNHDNEEAERNGHDEKDKAITLSIWNYSILSLLLIFNTMKQHLSNLVKQYRTLIPLAFIQ